MPFLYIVYSYLHTEMTELNRPDSPPKLFVICQLYKDFVNI